MLSKKDNYTSLQDLLEHHGVPESLSDAKVAVREHVQLRERLDRSGLDHLCETMGHTIGKIRPNTSNPDFQATIEVLEELSISLKSSLTHLEKLWEAKGGKLDHALQLGVFLNDTEQQLKWVQDQCKLLSWQLTDIGMDSNGALLARKHTDEFSATLQVCH